MKVNKKELLKCIGKPVIDTFYCSQYCSWLRITDKSCSCDLFQEYNLKESYDQETEITKPLRCKKCFASFEEEETDEI
jgi:hypothetical protein